MEPSHREFISLLVVAIAAFVVPILLSFIPKRPIPSIVGEVAAGIALGTSGIGWIHLGPAVDFLFLFGLAFLLMLAGLEIDVRELAQSLQRGNGTSRLRSPLVISVLGMASRLVIAIGFVSVLAATGIVENPTLVGILLTSTSVGIVLAVLKERELARTSLGQLIMMSSAVADLTTVVLLSVFFSVENRTIGSQLLVVGMVVVVGLAALGALRLLAQPVLVRNVLDRLAGHTTQIRLRGSLAILLVFVAITGVLGVESILGAFIAGLILIVLSPGERGEKLRDDLGLIGFSFFIPAFFVLAGARLNLRELMAHSDDMILVPVLLVVLLIAKVGTAPLIRLTGLSWRESFGAGMLQSAQLTLTIAGVEIGLRIGLIDESLGAALVLVAIISVVVAPLLFSALVPVVDGGEERMPQPRGMWRR